MHFGPDLDTNCLTLRWYCRAHPAISHCSHCYQKCRVATIISHWLKLHSRWLKNYSIFEKVYFDQLFECSNIAFIISCHFIIVQYLTLWMLPPGYQTVWIQIRSNILLGLILVQTVCRGYRQTTKVIASGQRVRYRTSYDTTF